MITNIRKTRKYVCKCGQIKHLYSGFNTDIRTTVFRYGVTSEEAFSSFNIAPKVVILEVMVQIPIFPLDVLLNHAYILIN